jgi:hydrogenase nickel incorporation protein HypA/HybF
MLMHEFSIVQSLLSLVEEYAHREGAKSVSKIVLQVGTISGVEIPLLKRAFDTFKEGTIAQEAHLEIEIENLRLRCLDCGKVSEKEEINAICDSCGSVNTQVVGGEEMLLKSLELEIE